MLAARQERLPVAPRQGPVALALPRGVVRFDGFSRPQRRLPGRLQGAGDQPVFGRDGLVWALRALGLNTRPLHASLPVAFAPAGVAFAWRAGCHRQCHCVRLERWQHHLLAPRGDIGGAALVTARLAHRASRGMADIARALPPRPARAHPPPGPTAAAPGDPVPPRRAAPRRS